MGKSILIEWKNSIEAACATSFHPSDFLTIEYTENLRTAFFERVRECDARSFWARDKYSAIVTLIEATEFNSKRDIILFHSKDKCIGALKLKEKLVFENVNSIWQITKEDFSISTETLESGLCLEENYYDRLGNFVADGILELTSWGDFLVASQN